MSDEPTPVERYEPPRIAGRDPIDVPLIGTTGSPVIVSAAFRSDSPEPYEAPRILARDPIDVPLIGFGSGVVTCASFRSQ